MKDKPTFSDSKSNMEIEKAKMQLDNFEENIKEMTMDRMNTAPRQETEPQTKLSQNQIANSKDIYLKPYRTISSAEKFNENFRRDYEHAREYVYFIAENRELIGETIELWTKPFPGLPAEEWKVPANKPVWGPRYLAEQLARKFYHRLIMKESAPQGSDQYGEYKGQLVSDTCIPRIECRKATKTTNAYFGSSGIFD